jgi:diguanylate cyclase (GGDEF)-like protein
MTGARAGDVIALDLDGKTDFYIGRSRSADIHIDESGVSRTHCRLVRDADGFAIQDLGSTNGTLVNGERVASTRLVAGDRIQIGPETVVQLGLFDSAEDTLARRLFDASTRDHLTGAINRRHFDERLAAEVAYARRHGAGLAVLLVDLDFFKAINDTAGHAAGDAVLQAVVGALSSCVRTEDVVCRHGGEEFALLFRVNSTDGARLFAERVRAQIQSLQIPFGDEILRVTGSIGVAELFECPSQTPADDLVGLADSRLYRAKHLGRNRVCVA